MGCRRAGDNPIIWTNDGTVSWHIYCEIRPRWVKGRWPRRSSWRHIGFSDYVAIVFVFTVYCVLGTSLLLWIYAPIYSYYCPYKHYLLPMCFKCLYILPLYILYILCIYTFMYWKSGTSDLLVLMFSLFYNVPTINKIFLLLLLLLLVSIYQGWYHIACWMLITWFQILHGYTLEDVCLYVYVLLYMWPALFHLIFNRCSILSSLLVFRK